MTGKPSDKDEHDGFHIDPWKAARRYFDQRCQEFMVALMRHLKLTQIEIPYSVFVAGPGTIDMRELPEKQVRFYRIVGEMAVEPPAAVPECGKLDGATPRTDTLLDHYGVNYEAGATGALKDLARQLERELAAVRADSARAMKATTLPEFQAALGGAVSARPFITDKTSSEYVPLCDAHAASWFTERNHLKGGMDAECVVCAFEQPPSSIARSTTGERQAAMGRILLKYIDRLTDPVEGDPLEKIVSELDKDVHALWAAEQDTIRSASGKLP